MPRFDESFKSVITTIDVELNYMLFGQKSTLSYLILSMYNVASVVAVSKTISSSSVLFTV